MRLAGTGEGIDAAGTGAVGKARPTACDETVGDWVVESSGAGFGARLGVSTVYKLGGDPGASPLVALTSLRSSAAVWPMPLFKSDSGSTFLARISNRARIGNELSDRIEKR
jgi:hypothetical protein